MNEWQPIETAPKDGTGVLVHNNYAPGLASGKSESCDDINTVVAAWWANEDDKENGEWMCYMDSPCEPECPFEPTHWMPLPEPPK